MDSSGAILIFLVVFVGAFFVARVNFHKRIVDSIVLALALATLCCLFMTPIYTITPQEYGFTFFSAYLMTIVLVPLVLSGFAVWYALMSKKAIVPTVDS